MLLLSRQRKESIIINDEIEITILKIDKTKVQIGITAPLNVPIFRKEIHQALKQENQFSARSSPATLQKAIRGLKHKTS